MWSRMGRTSGSASPAGSGIGQSSWRVPGTQGQGVAAAFGDDDVSLGELAVGPSLGDVCGDVDADFGR